VKNCPLEEETLQNKDKDAFNKRKNKCTKTTSSLDIPHSSPAVHCRVAFLLGRALRDLIRNPSFPALKRRAILNGSFGTANRVISFSVAVQFAINRQSLC